MVGKSLYIVFAVSFPAGRVRLLPAYKPNKRVSFTFTPFSGILQTKCPLPKLKSTAFLSQRRMPGKRLKGTSMWVTALWGYDH